MFARFQDDIHTSHTKLGNRLLHIVDSDGYGAARAFAAFQAAWH
ncbi:MAG: hypothetical protein OXP73_04460 [Chloroflexota bacterium]|nr:hypothetical protein [Chloroflexota bacterium]